MRVFSNYKFKASCKEAHMSDYEIARALHGWAKGMDGVSVERCEKDALIAEEWTEELDDWCNRTYGRATNEANKNM